MDAAGHKGKRDEIGDRQALGISDEFLPDGGDNRTFEPLWWRGYRFLDLLIHTGDQPLTLKSLETKFTAYPFHQEAFFRSSDAELNRIFDIAWYTGRLNAHDTYMDSAAVEQLQYVADIRPQLLVSYAVTGDDRLAREAIDAIDQSRIPEGITQARWPNNIFQVTIGYPLLWIGMLHDYWQWRPDPEYVSGHLLGTRTVLDYFMKHQGEDGMLTRLPFGNWQDWIGKDYRDFPREDAQGRSALITLEYVQALRQAAELEDSFGYKFLSTEYRRRADIASAAVYRMCWDDRVQLMADTPDKTTYSQHVSAWAVLTDTVPRAQQADLLRRISVEEFPSFARPAVKLDRATYYFRFYLARAYEHAGMAAEYTRLLAPWRAMLSRGFTTFPETPEPTREEAQGWGSHPAFDLLATVAGIQPGALGFARIHIEPHLAGLTSLDAAAATPNGPVHVRYAVHGGKVDAELTLPAGAAGDFVWAGTVHSLHGGVQRFTEPVSAAAAERQGRLDSGR